MAEQKIRNAYKNFMFKFSPFLNANKNVGNIDLVDDKSVSDFSPARFNFYSQVMESIVNSNPEIVKKVFNTVNLFKYKHNKIEKDIQDIKSRITTDNRVKIAHYLNKYIDDDKDKFDDTRYKLEDDVSDAPKTLEQRIDAYKNMEKSGTVSTEEYKLDKPEDTHLPQDDIKKIMQTLITSKEDLDRVEKELKDKIMNSPNDNSLDNKLKAYDYAEEIVAFVEGTLTGITDPTKFNRLISTIDVKLSNVKKTMNYIKKNNLIPATKFLENIKILLQNIEESSTIVGTQKDYNTIWDHMLTFMKELDESTINGYTTHEILKNETQNFTILLKLLYYYITGIVKSVGEFYNLLKTENDDFSKIKFKDHTPDTRKKILKALHAAIIFAQEALGKINVSDVSGKFANFEKNKDINSMANAINNLLNIENPTGLLRGGGTQPSPLEQAINRYYEDPDLSPNIDKVNLRDRGIFVALTFIIRAIALFITEWSIYSGYINTFSQSFNMYFGVYLCIFVLVLILTNANNEDITFFKQLFYYVNVESEDGKGLVRILLQITCIFFILPIPYMVKDFRLKDTTPTRVLTYTDKSNIYYSVDKFTLFAWILTSIVTLSV